jgi:tetratricopeptide (TPR) repeat protein
MIRKIKKLIEQAEHAFAESNYAESVRILEEAIELLPNEKRESNVALRVFAAIGDAHFLLGNYQIALEHLEEAANCDDGFNNPFVLLRRGECCFYLGDHQKASIDIIGAYMLEGDELFEGEPQEILDFLKKVKSSGSSADFVKAVNKDETVSSVQENDLFTRWPRNRNLQRMEFALAQPIYKLAFSGEYEKAWAMVPEPKLDWCVGVEVAEQRCTAALEKGDLQQAKEWLEVLLATAYSDINHMPFDLGGRVFLEMGDEITAFQFFEYLDKNWGKTYFSKDKKYLTFYQEQKSLRKGR